MKSLEGISLVEVDEKNMEKESMNINKINDIQKEKEKLLNFKKELLDFEDCYIKEQTKKETLLNEQNIQEDDFNDCRKL